MADTAFLYSGKSRKERIKRMLIQNVTLHPVGGPVIESGFLLIEGAKIARLGPMTEWRGEAGDHSFAGLHVYPGLVDAHSHLGMFGDSLGAEGEDGNEETDPSTPHLRAIDAINAMDRGFTEALDYGVTTVVTGPGSANPISGQMAAVKTSGVCIDDMVLNPYAAMKFALGENPKNVYAHRSQTPTTRMATAAVIREQLFRARRYGEDLDAYEKDEAGELDPPEFDAKCEALLPVLRGEAAAHFHAHRADDIFTACRIAREFSLRAVIIHGTEGYLIADRLAQTGIPVVCGPMIGSRSKPELSAMSRENPAILARSGVPIAICTDHPEVPAEFLMLSAAIACREGLPPEKAIDAVTLGAAKICGLEARVGSLEPGKDADLVFYRADPLNGLEKPEAVFINGVRVR